MPQALRSDSSSSFQMRRIGESSLYIKFDFDHSEQLTFVLMKLFWFLLIIETNLIIDPANKIAFLHESVMMRIFRVFFEDELQFACILKSTVVQAWTLASELGIIKFLMFDARKEVASRSRTISRDWPNDCSNRWLLFISGWVTHPHNVLSAQKPPARRASTRGFSNST